MQGVLDLASASGLAEPGLSAASQPFFSALIFSFMYFAFSFRQTNILHG
jgi:hypothetical protein